MPFMIFDAADINLWSLFESIPGLEKHGWYDMILP